MRFFALSTFLCLFTFFNHTVKAQKLEYWEVGRTLIFEEHLVGRDDNYFIITLSIRYRGDTDRKFKLIAEKKIKSLSPQDCPLIKVAGDTIVVERYKNQDLVTYKIKRGANPKFLRPVYDPTKQWKIEEIE